MTFLRNSDLGLWKLPVGGVLLCIFMVGHLPANENTSQTVSAEPARKANLPPDVEFFVLELSDNTDLIVDDPSVSGETPVEAESEPAKAVAEVSLAPPTNLKQFWLNKGISSSMRETFTDGVPWSTHESSLLLKFQYEMREIPPQFTMHWARPEKELARFSLLSRDLKNDERFSLYRITGTLQSVVRVPLPKEYDQRYQMKQYWIADMLLETGQKVTVFCTKVPRTLQPGGLLDVRVAAYAILMKEGVGQPPHLYMLTNRLEYLPHNFLGDHGMDYGLFDDLDRKPLDPKDMRSRMQDLRLGLHNRECFYQLLYHVSSIPRDELKHHSAEVIGRSSADRLTADGRYSHPLPLFQNPLEERGNYFLIRGTVKEAIPVRVEDEDVVERFGITGYYQLAIFTPEMDNNPIFIMVTELPEGMEPGQHSEYSVEVTVPAFFFNTWSYSSRDEKGRRVKRLTPLLMGGRPIFTPPPEPVEARWIETVLAVCISGGILVITFMIFYNERKDRAARKRYLASHHLPEGEVFDETKIDREGYPDFSNWGNDESQKK